MSDESQDQIKSLEGTVKWFDPRKGFGFIIGPQGQDIFAHFSVIEGEGFKALRDGSIVVYDAVRSDKGWKATRVVRKEEPPEVSVVKRSHSRTPRR